MDKKVWKVWNNYIDVFENWNFEKRYHEEGGRNYYNWYYMEMYDWEFSKTKCIYEMSDCILGENDIVVDLGSNIGLFTRYAAEKCKKVISVEGSPEFFSCLVENTSDIKNISYLNANVVGIENKKSDTWSSNPTLINVTLEEIFNLFNLDHIDFLKVDIEGGEYSIFDIDPFYLNKINKIAIETHDDNRNFELSSKIGKKLFRFDWSYGDNKQIMFYFT
jgi:FkbM family methyltransferase